ncbi:MAG: glutathione S-transferase [Reyranella sp.]|jgi:glutathione S-transferase|nr:glutathione S-transferase [Reyranella sp.]
MDIELLQFRYSPYNEKARWALDLKQLPHRRTDLMPGPHMAKVRKISGQTATPVLVVDGRAIAGSAAILRELDRLRPEPPLHCGRPEVAAVERKFDDDLGPRIRRKVLALLLEDHGYFCRVFAEGQSALGRTAYRMMLPLAQGMVRRGNGITGRAAIDDGESALQEGLALVAERSRATGYLVGADLTAADIAAASILAMVVDPPDSTMTKPRPMPAGNAAWIASVQAHPGAAWVRAIYARHRRASRP